MKLEVAIAAVIGLLFIIAALIYTGFLDPLLFGTGEPAPIETNDITCVPGAVKQPDGTCILEN